MEGLCESIAARGKRRTIQACFPPFRWIAERKERSCPTCVETTPFFFSGIGYIVYISGAMAFISAPVSLTVNFSFLMVSGVTSRHFSRVA